MNTIKYPKYESAFQSGIGDLKDLELTVQNGKFYLHNGVFFDEKQPYWLYGEKHYTTITVPSNQIVPLVAKNRILTDAPITVTVSSDELDCIYNKIYNYPLGSDNYILHQTVPGILTSNEFYAFCSDDYVYLCFSSDTINNTYYVIYDSSYWRELDYEANAAINYKLYDHTIIYNLSSDEYPAEITLHSDIDFTIGPNISVTLLATVKDRFGTPLRNKLVEFIVYPSNQYSDTYFSAKYCYTNDYGDAFTYYTIPSNVIAPSDIAFFAKCATINPINSTVNYISDRIVINICKQREQNI